MAEFLGGRQPGGLAATKNKQWDIYVKLIGSGPPLRLTSEAGIHYWPACSPDGKWMAFTARHNTGRNGLFLIPALGGPEAADGVGYLDLRGLVS